MSGGKADYMILLPVVLLLLSAATRAVSPVSRVADADDPPARVARISYLKGSVSLQVSGDTGWSEATLNYRSRRAIGSTPTKTAAPSSRSVASPSASRNPP